MITLHVEPRKVVSWKIFQKEAPPFSLALDGYVSGPPQFCMKGPHANLNHHEDVDRLATRCTAAQVLLTIKQGLFDSFRKEGVPFAHVYVNDPDQDTSLSVWLLQNHERISGVRSEPLISRLVFCSDMLDATAGGYPFDPDSEIVRELAWIYEPYDLVRQSGHLSAMSSGEMKSIIEAVCSRITMYSLGKGEKIVPDTRYDTLFRGTGWSLVQEHGSGSRSRIFQDGVKAFISVRNRPDGKFIYSIGRISPFIPFPVIGLYAALNQFERIPKDSADRWGGGNTIGGSPRNSGSALDPSLLYDFVEAFLEEERKTL